MHNKEYDVAADGEYEGFKKLIGHALREYFDIYFSLNDPDRNFSYKVKSVQIKPLNGYMDLTQEAAERHIKRIAERYIERTYEPEDSFRAKWMESWLNPI